jgi:hypothetical protein
MDPQPQLTPDDFRQQLQQRFDQLCQQIADAVNQAPPGQVINASEERVRDLFADFREHAYQAALQARLDAAQAASPPSPPPPDRSAPAQQGA